MKRSLLLGFGGLAYGALLAMIGLGAANGGDGVMIPLYVFGSPLFIPLLFFAPIIIWPTVTLVLSQAHRSNFKTIFLSLMVIHYLGGLAYLIAWGDWDRLSALLVRSWMSVFILIASYFVGQTILWSLFAATQQIVGRERRERVSHHD
jgi:hypothetical protein